METPERRAVLERELEKLTIHNHHREEIRAADARLRSPQGQPHEHRFEADSSQPPA